LDIEVFKYRVRTTLIREAVRACSGIIENKWWKERNKTWKNKDKMIS
jgi:hypothetical protein